MKRQKWFDRKFTFEHSHDEYNTILTQLLSNPDKISELVSELPEEILSNKVDGKWSIKENVGHLIDLEELHDSRIDDFISGKKKLRPADLNNKKTDEANHNSKNISELLERLKIVREIFVKRLKALNKKVLTHTSIHPRLNQPMRPIDMAQFVLEHDEHHIETIKEIINTLQ
jgi:uncharacterized damage-inducible protein DinB